MLALIVVLGVYPNLLFTLTDPAVHVTGSSRRTVSEPLDACADGHVNPNIDFHAFAPEIVLTATILVVLIADLIWPRERWQRPRIASIGVLAALIPVITLAADGTDRVMFGGAYVVDPYALAFKALLPRRRLRRRC